MATMHTTTRNSSSLKNGSTIFFNRYSRETNSSGRLERGGRRIESGQAAARTQNFFNVLMGAINQDQNCLFGFDRVAGNHGIEHGAVQREGVGRPPFFTGRQFKAGTQQRTKRLAHMNEHPIATGPQQTLVKTKVMSHIITTLFDSTL